MHISPTSLAISQERRLALATLQPYTTARHNRHNIYQGLVYAACRVNFNARQGYLHSFRAHTSFKTCLLNLVVTRSVFSKCPGQFITRYARVKLVRACTRCRREGVARSCLGVQVDVVRVQEWRRPAVVAANSSLALLCEVIYWRSRLGLRVSTSFTWLP